jgi:hypothetical protein
LKTSGMELALEGALRPGADAEESGARAMSELEELDSIDGRRGNSTGGGCSSMCCGGRRRWGGPSTTTGARRNIRTTTTATTCVLVELGIQRRGRPVACARVGVETTGREESKGMVVSGRRGV